MMTDKPTSQKNDNVTTSKEPKANSITKSTQKPTNTSSKNSPPAKVSVNMSDSTKAVTDNSVINNRHSAEKSAEPIKSVTKNTAQKKPNETVKPPSSSQKDKKPMKSEPSSKISKVAILSLLIALLAVAGVVFIYFWHVQQQTNLTTQLAQIKKSTAESNLLAQNEMLKTLKNQEENLADKFSESVNNMKSDTESNIEQLNEMVEKFSQNQPTDWLVHEAEYLVRIAARTLWLEKNTTAAIGLLQDADARIAELNDPEILPIRQLIYQDIETLKLVPKLEIEEAILSLMALGEQVQSLPLLTLSIPQENTDADRFKLSEDISDWRGNVSKTWDRFLDTFVVVHNRVGELEPILPVDQRENVKENLSLKLQVAQWAASKGQNDVFVKSLTDAQLWLTKYFEMNDVKNKAFIESIEKVKSKVILTTFESKLESLTAIRQILAGRAQSKQPIIQPSVENKIKNDEVDVIEAVETVKEKEVVQNNENVEDATQNLQEKLEPAIENNIEMIEPAIESNIEKIEPIIEVDTEKSIEINENPIEKIEQKITEISEAV